MAYTKLLKNSRQHQPDIHGYCGPASMVTCLEALGADIARLRQAALYKMAHSADTSTEDGNWHSAPDLLVKAMNRSWPGAARVKYVLAVTADVAALNLAMAAGVELQGAPSIALIFGGGHWVSVVGYNAGRAITGPQDAACQPEFIDSINCGQPLLSNLHAPGDVPPQTLHSVADKCGGPDCGEPPLTTTPVGEWDDCDLTPDDVGEEWKGMRVAIVPALAGKHLAGVLPKSVKGDLAPLRGGGDDAVPVPAKVITSAQAKAAVRGLLQKSGLRHRPLWSTHLGKGDARAIPAPGTPVLVHHGSDARLACYIVPLTASRVAAIVDAGSGRVRQFGLFRRTPKFNAWTKKTAVAAIQKAAAQPRSVLKQPALTEVHPALVWQHGAQSTSPFTAGLAFRHEGKLWGVSHRGHIHSLGR